MNKPATALALSLTTALSGIALNAAPAHAGDDDVERARSCGGWRIELEVGPEDSGWEVESDIDDADAGSRWRVVVRQDGQRVYNDVRTAGPRGGVEVDLRRPATAGADAFRLITHPQGQPRNRCSLRIVAP